MASRVAVMLAVALALGVARDGGADAARVARNEAFVGYSERSIDVLRVRLDDGRAIDVRLRRDWAPSVARAIEGAVRACAESGTTCGEFYRAEATPDVGAVDNYGGPGPPYALLQGRLNGLSGKIEGEPPMVERGHACLIGSGQDFFIATRRHHEWGRAHAVFGEVTEASMMLVDDIAETYPRHPETWGATNVTVLNEKLAFSISILSE